MSRNGSGIYSLPAGNPVVTGTTISSTWANNTLSDIATALTASIAKDGQTTPTANLPMGGFKHTGAADASALTDYLTAKQALNSTAQYLSTISGSDTITASGTFTPSAYTAGQTFRFIAAGSNTGAVTLNVASLGAKNVYKRTSGGLVALVAKDLISGAEYSVTYDGTQFVLNEQRPYSQGADIASASTINLDTATGDYVNVTGTTPITAITLGQGEQRTVKFAGALTLTNGASLILPTGNNISTAAGDVAVFRGEASSVVRCVAYTLANGKSLGGVTQIQPISASVGSNALTISASTLTLDFRSTTLGSGTVTTVTGSPANLVVSSGSTLGTTNGVQSDLAVLALNNAGTIELAVVNLAGGVTLDEQGVVTTTAEGGLGAADSINVIYSTTARTNVAYRVIGLIRSTQATAGTWATAPSLIQGVGGVSLVGMPKMILSVSQATTSGTSIDFTSIPSWVKRITMTLIGVSTNGTSPVIVQIGSGSVDTSSYLGSAQISTSSSNMTSGFLLADTTSGAAAYVRHGTVTLTLAGSNAWGAVCVTGLSNQTAAFYAGGSKTLSGTLDRIRLTTAGGTDTFDAGSVAILVEGY